MYTAKINKKIDIRFVPQPRRYCDNLSCMIRCRTISRIEFYRKAEFEKFDRLLRERYPLVFIKAELYNIGDGTFLKIPGKCSDSPLVLMSHTDVVEADAKKWKHSPFAADLDGGRIWGRGAVDTKASLCAILRLSKVCSKRALSRRGIYTFCPRQMRKLPEQRLRLP